MMQPIHATFQKGVFRPVEPVELPDGCEVELQIIMSTEPAQLNASENGKTIQERLAELAAQVPSHEWDSLPADISDRLDDHLYGHPHGTPPE